MHLTEERHEHRRLSRTRRANNEAERAAGEAQYIGNAQAEGSIVGCSAPCEVGVCKAEVSRIRRCVDKNRLGEGIEELGLEYGAVSEHDLGQGLGLGLTLRRKSAMRPREMLAAVGGQCRCVRRDTTNIPVTRYGMKYMIRKIWPRSISNAENEENTIAAGKMLSDTRAIVHSLTYM